MIGIVPPWLNPGPFPLPGPKSSTVPAVHLLAARSPQWASGGSPACSTLANTSGVLWEGLEGARCVASSRAGDSVHSVARVLSHPTTTGGTDG